MAGDVSVIVPTRGDSPHLRRALRSALAADGTAEVVLVAAPGAIAPGSFADPRVRLVERPGPGPSAARNAGLDAARGRWLAFLDDDDLWLGDHLRNALDTAARHPGCVLVGCDAWLWTDDTPDGSADPPPDPSGLPRHAPELREGELTLRRLLLGNPLTTPTVLLDGERLRPDDRFDPSLDHMEDYDLWLRLALDRRLVWDPRPSVIVRRRRGSARTDWRGMAEGSLRVLGRLVERGLPPGTLGAGELRRRLGRLWHDLAYACLVEDDLPAAREAARRAIAHEPLRPKNWAWAVAGRLPGPLRRALLRRGRRWRAEHGPGYQR